MIVVLAFFTCLGVFAALIIFGTNFVIEHNRSRNDNTSSISKDGGSKSPESTDSPTWAPKVIPESTMKPSFRPVVDMAAPYQAPPVPAPIQIVYNPTGWPTDSPKEERKCNGLASLCSQAVNNILFATMHNANSDSFSTQYIAPNHERDFLQGLKAGIRGLNVDIGICNNELALVHGACITGALGIGNAFQGVHQFLTDNPNEVLIVPAQVNDETGGEVRLQDIYDAFAKVKDNQGKLLTDRLYAHPSPDTTWPTLNQLIESDKRLLFFQYNGNQTCVVNGCPPGFHDWFAHAGETRYSFPSVEWTIEHPDEACTITRGGSGSLSFFGVNVFLDVPKTESSDVLNEKSFLGPHLKYCALFQKGLQPNLVLVDYWSRGDVLDVVREWNSKLILP